jgi:hypothetical protein
MPAGDLTGQLPYKVRQRSQWTQPVISAKALAVLAAVLGGVAVPARSMELQGATVDAWQQYMRDAGLRTQARLANDSGFLWIHETQDRASRVRRGEIVVAPVAGRGTQEVPSGLIHDWIGGVFISNATKDSLLAVTHDYDAYKEIYKPAVTDSKSLVCNEGDQEFSMIWQRRVLFVNAAMQAWYQARDFVVDSRRGYAVIDATRIQQIENYGRSNQRLLPPDSGGGFVWRIHCITRYEQRDGGVYLEIEAIALSRDIPPSVRWLVSPVVNRLSINSLTTTLWQTREAVEARSEKAELRTCGGKVRK